MICRIHRSYTVNIRHIFELLTNKWINRLQVSSRSVGLPSTKLRARTTLPFTHPIKKGNKHTVVIKWTIKLVNNL